MVRIKWLTGLEELSIIPLLLSFSIIGPLVHESFHGLWLSVIKCPHIQRIGFNGVMLYGKTTPFCFITGWQFWLFCLAGLLGSVAVSALLSFLAMRLPLPASSHLQAFSTGILLSNTASLLMKGNDLAPLGIQWAAIPLVLVLSIMAIILMAQSLRRKEIY